MNSFSSQRINIVVDSVPQGILGTFIPGQTVSGKVIYTPQTQVDIDHVVIICKGTCFTKITKHHDNRTSRYPEKITLFKNQETIFRGPHTIPSGRYEWPFHLELPNQVDYLRKGRSRDNQYQLGSQGLPPTFKLDGEGFSTPPEAKVTYQLKVKVNPAKLIHSTKRVEELPLWPLSLTPLKSPLSLDNPCQGDGRFKSKSLRPTQHSFKEKMSHILTSDPSLKTPEINIVVSFKMPRCVSATQCLPLELSCKHTKMGQNDPESPELVFAGCALYLKMLVNVRATGTFSDHHDDGRQTVINYSIPGSQALLPLDGSSVSISKSIRLTDMTQHVHRLVPTFRTFTISMCYKMTVKLRIRHVQTGHLWKFENKFPFEILPGEVTVPTYMEQEASFVESGPSAIYPPQLQSENQASTSSSAAPPEFREEVAPPSYNSGDVWRTGPEAKEAY